MYRTTLAIISIPSLTAAVLLGSSFVSFAWRSLSMPTRSSSTLNFLYIVTNLQKLSFSFVGIVIFPKLYKQYSSARIFCWTSCNGSSTSKLSELLPQNEVYDGVQRFVSVQRPDEINGTWAVRICCNIFRFEGIHDVIVVVKRSNNKREKIILE